MRDEKGKLKIPKEAHEFGFYEVIAVGNKFQKLHWSEVTTFSCHHYCIASAILHDCGKNRKVLQLERGNIMNDIFFKHKLLDDHFKNVYVKIRELSVFNDKYVPVGGEDPTAVLKRYLSKGISILNILDIRAVPHMLSALTGYLMNSFPCLFLDLERDADDLYSPPQRFPS